MRATIARTKPNAGISRYGLGENLLKQTSNGSVRRGILCRFQEK